MIIEAPAQGTAVEKKEAAPSAVSTEVQPAVFERLHALVRKGYAANIGTETGTERIVLRHLGKAPDLVLHPNGLVEEHDGRRPMHKRHLNELTPIGADSDSDHLRFMRFLETVPKASLRDRTRPWRHKFVYFPLALFALWMACLAITALILEGG